MKKSLILLMVIFGIVSLHAQAMEFLKLREQQITPEVLNQIARNNAQVRGPSFDFNAVPYNLPDAVDLADPGTGKFYEDIPWTKDFTRHIGNSGGGPLYLYYSSPEHFNVSQPDPGNPFLLKFEPIPTHWHGSELMVLTVSDQPLDRGSTRASSTAIIRINVTSVPDPPVFDNLPPANRFFTDENVPITLNFRDYVQCIDSAWDNFDLFVMQTQDPINVMVSQAPNPASGHLVTFTPHPHYNSPLGVRFLVTAVDRASNGFSSIEMILVIHPINDPPEIVSYFPTDLDLVIDQDETQHFEVNAIDVDGDILTHSWTLEGTINGLPYSQVLSTTTELDHQFPHPGVFTLTYKAKDDWLEDSITWTITVKPIGPIFSPVPDPSQRWFTHGVAITLSLPTGYEGATIYYTTDGSIPQIGAPSTLIYEQPIDIPTLPNIENIKTIRAFFLHPTIPPASQVVSYTYRITGQVADPIFNPTGGSYYSQVSLNISCPNLSATIYYTTDGNDPVPGAPNTYEYSGPFTITTDTYMVVKAIAVRDDWIDSNIVVHTYNVTGVVMINSLVLDPPPPPDGDFYDVDIGDHLYLRVASMNITPATAILYYLLDPTPFDDDTLPGPGNPNSFIYTPGLEIPLNCPTIIKFRAFNDDWQPSGTIVKFYDVRTRTKIITFPAPNGSIFDPAPHISTVPLQVYINTVTEPLNAPIYYTTDGSDPIEDPALRYYGGPINLSQNFHTYTIKVLAHDPAFCPSQIYTGVFEITGAVDMPQFDPVPSSYQNPIAVTISTTAPGATIYYTLDGSDPDMGANLYSNPISMGTGTHILRAIAYKDNWLPSPVRTGTYRIGELPPPIFTSPSGTYHSPIVVHFTHTVPDVTILYSLTGGAPFTAYDPALGIPVAANQNVTITAYASKIGWADSEQVSATYNVTGSVAMPTFNPGGGSYPGVQNVTISCATPGATIRWTLDGQDPTLTHGSDYSVPVTIAHSATLKARAYFADWAPSAVNSADYTIFGNIAMPVFIPAPGNYTSAVDVHISVNPPTASIYYTVDGNDPDASSTLYTTGSPITIGLNSSVTLKAIAIQSGWNPSEIAEGTYNVTGRVATPTFSPAGGSFATPPLVAISTVTAGASIRYTTDGSDPNETHGELYSIPIQLTGSTLIKAIAYSDDWENSYISQANYVVNPQVAAPVFSPAGGYYNSAPQNVSISSYTPGAEIRYTLNGDEPDQLTGLLYDAPIAVDRRTTIRARAFKADHLDSAISLAEYFFITANPVLSPIAGAYPEPFTVRMDSSTAGASIRYTMDGSDPTPTDGIEYTGSFTLNQSATIRAIAYKDGWISSNVVIYSYVINGPVNAPQFSISGGDYYDSLSVSISTLPSNAAIYYTTNGDDPSDTNGILYEPANPVQITQNTTLKAKAYLANWLPSPISTAIYNLYTRPVTFNPAAGNYSTAIDVTMSSITPGARIWYTTNNTDPIIDVSTEYDFNPIHIGSDTTFKAIARVDGWHPSPISSAFYDIEIPLPSVATPEINYPSGVYTTELDVAITTTTEDAHIWYTLNGPDPNPSNGILYTGSFMVDTNTTVRARAYKAGHQVSGLASAQYIIVIPIQTVQTPAFSPDAGIYDNSVVVTISTATPDADIYYTTGGAEPDNNSIPYTGPITLTSTTNIKAIAYKAGMNTSLINSASYVINVIVPNVDTPVFNLASGLHHNPIDITITSTTPDAEIWYSLDGSDPAPSAPGSVLYTSSIHIASGQSRYFKARAFKTGYNPSPVVSANYNVTGTVADVVFSTPGGTYTTPQSLILTTSTPDATIRYTTDGSDPSPGSTPYVTAIAINTTMTVKARAYKTDWLDSIIGSEYYVITGSLAFDQPNLIPAPGTYSNPINVTIASPIPADADVWYTLDGNLPSETIGTPYTAPIPVDSALTLRAVAIKAGWVEAYVSGDYTFVTAAPGFTPDSGSYPNAQTVSLGSSTIGALIRYTTDGSDPSATNGFDYTGSILVDINQTIKAYAIKPGYLDSPIVSATYAIGTYIPVVDTPVLSLVTGTYPTVQTVTMSVTAPGAAIHYTNDGNEPTELSMLYTDSIILGLDTITTIKAKAFKPGWLPSATATERYVITGQVAAPTFTPDPGDYTSAQNVVLLSATEGAYFRYTLNGDDPTSSSPLYITPINVPLNQTTTIKARAYKSGWADSEISTGIYNVTGRVAFMPPVFTPPAGTYGSDQTISISAPVPAVATVKYTVDGSIPSPTHGFEYTGSFTVDKGTLVQAIAYLDGWEASQIVSAQYHFAVGAPVYTPPSGTYPSIQLQIASPTPGASIRYTTDNSDPSETAGELYTGEIDLPGDTTYQFKAIAYKDGWQSSVIVPATYNVTGSVAAPVFSIPSGTYTTAQNLVLSTATPGAAIYYTTSGEAPTQSSTLYTTAIELPLNSSHTIRARAYRNGWLSSDIAVGVYNITGTAAFDQPHFNPAPGTYSNAINVSIANPIPATAQVWYTIDGTAPSETNGTLYTGPIAVDNAMVIKAVVIRTGWTPSYISGDYDFMAAAPGFMPPAGSYEQSQNVVLSSATIGATIRYTTDGTDPSPTNGMNYTMPILVNINQTIKAYSMKAGYQDSPIVSATYAIGTYVPVVATPLFNPLPGTYSDPFSVAIATSTPGATIRYTTNGTTPDATSDAYTTPIYIGNHTTMTIKAIAFKDEWDDSQMAEGTYIVTGAVQEVSFSPVGGSFTTAQNVTLSTTTAGAAIYYTIDGTDPNENTLPYTQPIVVPLNTTNLTIKARAYKNTWSPSTITSQTYTVTGQVTIPGNVFTPAAGVYTTAQSVTIATVTDPAAATIRYTEDGSDPTATSPVYTGQQIALPLNTTKTVKARAYLTDWDDSPVYTATYTVTGTIAWPATIFSPAAGTYQTAQNITISYPAVPTGTSIYYTLDGSDPSQSSLLYQGPISLPLNSGNTTIKARAYKADWTPSVIATAIYNVTGTVTYMTPVFLPDPSVIYTSPVSVTINQVNPTGATVRYTLDSTEPTQTSPAYTGTINLGLNTTTTIKTKAFLTDWTSSQTHTASYTVTGQVAITAPVFNPAPGTFTAAQTITISSNTVPTGAVIRYTTDGSEPTSTSPIYTNPIPAPAYSTTRIKAKAFVTNWLPSPTYEGIYVVNGAAIINGPVFTPPAGTYATAQNLVISQNTLPMDATLYYTTDGTDPSTTNGILYSDPIHLGLDQTITVKVRAYGNSNWEPSIIHTAVYHITGQVLIPDAVFSPNPATVYTEAQTVTINAPVPANATVYYTTDGSDPAPDNTEAVEYNDETPIAIPLNTVMTLRARAYLTDWTPSPIYTTTYKVTGKVQLAAELLDPVPGVYTTPQTLTITAPVLPQGAIIRYTITPDLTDPTQAPDPDETSAQYTSPIQIPYDSNWVIKIGGFARDWIDSDVVIAPYTVTGTVQQPQYIINGEEVLEDVLAGEQITLSLISATDDATIYYTTALGADPATPTENDMLFDPDQPIVITELTMDLRIRARAFKNDWVPSDEESFSFTVIPLPYDVRAFTYAGYIRLLWNSDITAKGLDGFNVYRRKLNSSVWTKLNTALVNSKIGIDYYYDDYAIENGVSYVYRITAIYSGIESPYSVTTTIEYQSSELDVNDATHAYPNPASSSTKIKLVLSRNDNVQVAVSIYDYSGKKIRTLTVPSTSSNLIEIPWDLKNSDGKKVGRGTYFARIVANDGVKKAERTIKISVK